MPHNLPLLSFIFALLPLLGPNLLAQDNVGERSVEPKSKIPLVVRLGSWRGHQVDDVVRRDSPPESGRDPLTIKSTEQVAKYFKEAFVVKWREQVDFDKQELLVWMWRGSGQDELECFVSLSDPTKVLFWFEHGKSKDIDEHLYVFAIRKDVQRVPRTLSLDFGQ
jgi:hypothetical protein